MLLTIAPQAVILASDELIICDGTTPIEAFPTKTNALFM